MTLRVAIGSDHGGYDHKKGLIEWLANRGFSVVDCGTYTPEATDYPIFAARVAGHVARKGCDIGIILCRSGNGVAIVANRFPGVRAGIATNTTLAKLACEHNNTNVLVIGSDYVNSSVEEVAAAWLEAKFEGGRHQRRVSQIDAIDAMSTSHLAPYRALASGQSIWLEEDSAELVRTEALGELAARHGLRGLLPRAQNMVRSILEGKAEYGALLQDFRDDKIEPREAWTRLVVMDTRAAADVLDPLFHGSAGEDGIVCLDPAPPDARDTARIQEEARKLVRAVDRPNVMVRVPATAEGLEAVTQLTSEGISTLVTKIFSLNQYKRATDAYLAGLDRRRREGAPLWTVRSGAAIPIQPLEAMIASEVDAKLGEAVPPRIYLNLELIRDRVALALCQVVMQEFRARFLSPGFGEMTRLGANIQRIFWMETTPPRGSTLRDVHYAEELVAPYTVNCLNRATFQAFLDHGQVRPDRLEESGFVGRTILELLGEMGIDLEATAESLQAAEVEKSSQNYQQLLALLGRAMGR